MGSLRSIRSFNRARTNERGFALAMALIIAVLYFGLIELMLYDASRELAEARRFRARIVAWTLAENGAELAAVNLVDHKIVTADAEGGDWQGTITGAMKKDTTSGKFEITGNGTATGVVQVSAEVRVFGEVVDGTRVRINNTYHSQ
jgi:hypothetical protein